MSDITMGVIETKFADLIWSVAPVSSSCLVVRAQQELGWKKSTTYTVLKRLCDKGIFENSGGMVTVKMDRAAFYSLQSQQFVENHFEGSLPAFFAAFTNGKRLTPQEVAELQRLLQAHKED